MTTTDDEVGFHMTLADNPSDNITRLVLADYLEEQDDPRATGYRALVRCNRRVDAWRNGNKDNRGTEFMWWDGLGDTVNRRVLDDLPHDWWCLVQLIAPQRQLYALIFQSRREAEDAAAVAFTKLPPDRQRELLQVV